MGHGYTFQKTTQWNESFFARFVAFRNGLYRDDPFYLREKVEDFHRHYRPDSLFSKKYWWQAIMLMKDGELVARAVVNYPLQEESSVLHTMQMGHVEFLDIPLAFAALMEEVKTEMRRNGIRQLKAPIQQSFFHSYRMLVPKKEGPRGIPFYSEPLCKDYYLSTFQEYGFKISKSWRTSRLNFRQGLKNFKQVRNHVRKKDRKFQKLKVHFIWPWRFEKKLRIVHGLFMESYRQMPEFSPISVEEFIELYGGLKYIINPFFSYIITFNKKPVGFCINYFDPLPIFLQHQRREQWIEEKTVRLALAPGHLLTKAMLKISSLMTLIRLQFNFKRLLISYVGKIPDESGTEFKGIQAAVSRYLGPCLFLVQPKEILVCYTAEDSPAQKSFQEAQMESDRTYVMLSFQLDGPE